jgi:hypothetical protein
MTTPARGIDSGEAGETRSGSTPKGQEPGPEGSRPEESRAQPSLHIEPALGYAQRLAEAIWSKYYKADAPHWKPLDDVLGVLTQIDNMTSGLSRSPTTPTEGPALLTEDDVFTLMGHAEVLRGDGQADMPTYFGGLAGRIARAIGRIDLAEKSAAIESKVRASTLTDPEGAS